MIGNKDHINYTADDIRQYWNGQLSPGQMHAMEKAALDDPFLADALEGMGEALQQYEAPAIEAELEKLHQQVAARTATRDTPVVKFAWWKLAAAALVLLVLGFWIFMPKDKEREVSGLAQQDAVTEKKNQAAASIPDSTPPATSQAGKKEEVDVTAGVQAYRDTLKVSNTPPLTFSATKESERELADFETKAAPKIIDSLYVLPGKQQARSIAVSVENSKPPAAARDSLTVNAFAKIDDKKPETEVLRLSHDQEEKIAERKQEFNNRQQNIISGVVTDNQNNPLGNAFLRLENRGNYVTDPRGNFKIPVTVADSVLNVSVSKDGYPTQQFTLRNSFDGAGNVTDNQLRMQPNDLVNDKTIVVGYGTAQKKSMKSAPPVTKLMGQDAQPAYGWLSYDQYLEKNKRKPESNPNLTGEVVLSFQVNKKGELTGFKVEQSLSPQHDAEALRLVREGPPWKLNKGRKSRVTVIVRF